MHAGMLDRILSIVFLYVDMVLVCWLRGEPGVGAEPGGDQ